jgi:DNA-binding NarL/FixJ family response regulator
MLVQRIRILLVDDHQLFRESLGRLLDSEPDLEVVATCGSASEALNFLEQAPVDVVLLDYDLGEEQGSVFLETAKQRASTSRILLVTAGMSDATTLRVFETGASGIFLKHSNPPELIRAIRTVFKGETWLDPKAAPSLVAGATSKSEQREISSGLNERQRAVLEAVLEGLTNKEIAGRLRISESSIKAVMQQLFDRAGVRTRSRLVRIALEKQLHEQPEH